MEIKDFIGEKPKWSYTYHSVGLRGVGKINNASGTLSVNENIVSISGNRNPLSIVNTYNNINYNELANASVGSEQFENGYGGSAPTGLGWTLDFNQLIYEIDSSHYQYVAPDGAKYNFSLHGGEIIDEEGLGLKIESGSGKLYIKDQANNKLTFEKKDLPNSPILSNNSCFVLVSSEDVYGNKTTYKYNLVPCIVEEETPEEPEEPDTEPTEPIYIDVLRVTEIEEATGRVTLLRYNDYGMVSEIETPDGKKIAFEYGGNNPRNIPDFDKKLTSVTYPDGLKTSYIYDEQERLQKVRTTEGTGRSVGYKYSSNDEETPEFYKMETVTEYGISE